MKKYTHSIATLFLALISLSILNSAMAESLYISDKLYVPIRKGQGNQFSILHKGLPSGTKVTLVKRDTDWTQVTTEAGITGWIRNQFLDKQPPAAIKLNYANKKIERLTKELSDLKTAKKALETNYQQAQTSLQDSKRLINTTQDELRDLKSISASAVESHQRLQTLAEKMQLMQTENDVLKSENENLRRSERTTFFMYGAFAVLLGVIAAIIAPKLKTQRRNDGWIN